MKPDKPQLSQEGLEQRLQDKIIVVASGCWEWQGCRNSQGYGSVRFNRRWQRAHRVFWQIFRGTIPRKMCVCHKCDNPSCVNPEHLWLGTIAENNQDKINKGRLAVSPTGNESWSRQHLDRIARGANAGQAKITEAQVKEIINRAIAGEKYREIAKDYPVTESAISAIMQGNTWMHIKRPKLLRRIVKKNG